MECQQSLPLSASASLFNNQSVHDVGMQWWKLHHLLLESLPLHKRYMTETCHDGNSIMCWWNFTRFTSTVWKSHNDNASMYKLSSTNTCTMAVSQKIWTWIWTNWPSGMECLTYWPEAYERLTTRHVELLCLLQLPKSRCWEDRRAPAIYESFQAPRWWESTGWLNSVNACQGAYATRYCKFSRSSCK